MKRLKSDELYILRLDNLGRARGARFAQLTDDVASAAVDLKCRVLICPTRPVAVLAMKLPAGRFRNGRLVVPRIRRALYEVIQEAATIATKREAARLKAGAAKQSAFVKKLIADANAAVAEARESRRRTNR
jgi:hypothetical protein